MREVARSRMQSEETSHSPKGTGKCRERLGSFSRAVKLRKLTGRARARVGSSRGTGLASQSGMGPSSRAIGDSDFGGPTPGSAVQYQRALERRS